MAEQLAESKRQEVDRLSKQLSNLRQKLLEEAESKEEGKENGHKSGTSEIMLQELESENKTLKEENQAMKAEVAKKNQQLDRASKDNGYILKRYQAQFDIDFDQY